jgi:anti-sigma regulatory factor (Ser/Thr protein kinase)
MHLQGRTPAISLPPLDFACDPSMGRAVRCYVRDRVHAGRRSDLVDESETVASELFSNAVHAQERQGVTTVICVQCLAGQSGVTIDVYDHATGRPYLRNIDKRSATNGRGLWLVNEITGGQWGWTPWGSGKVVAAMITEPLAVAEPRFIPAHAC